MRVTYRRQVPIPGIQYSNDEVIIEDDVPLAEVEGWLRQARLMAKQGMSDWKATEPMNVKSAGDAKDPAGKPTGEQRKRIRLLVDQCAKRKLDTSDIAPPTSYLEAEDILQALRQRLAAKSQEG